MPGDGPERQRSPVPSGPTPQPLRARRCGWGLPVVVVLVAVGAIGRGHGSIRCALLAKLPVDVGGVVVSGTKITMQQPRLAGYHPGRASLRRGRPAAAQDVTNPDLLELEDIHATMEMQDNSKVDSHGRETDSTTARPNC